MDDISPKDRSDGEAVFEIIQQAGFKDCSLLVAIQRSIPKLREFFNADGPCDLTPEGEGKRE